MKSDNTLLTSSSSTSMLIAVALELGIVSNTQVIRVTNTSDKFDSRISFWILGEKSGQGTTLVAERSRRKTWWRNAAGEAILDVGTAPAMERGVRIPHLCTTNCDGQCTTSGSVNSTGVW